MKKKKKCINLASSVNTPCPFQLTPASPSIDTKIMRHQSYSLANVDILGVMWLVDEALMAEIPKWRTTVIVVWKTRQQKFWNKNDDS